MPQSCPLTSAPTGLQQCFVNGDKKKNNLCLSPKVQKNDTSVRITQSLGFHLYVQMSNSANLFNVGLSGVGYRPTLSCRRLRSVLSLSCQRSHTHRSPVASDLLKAHFSLRRDPTGSCSLSLIASAGSENQYKSFSIGHACCVCVAPALFSRQVRGKGGSPVTFDLPYLASVVFIFLRGPEKKC